MKRKVIKYIVSCFFMGCVFVVLVMGNLYATSGNVSVSAVVETTSGKQLFLNNVVFTLYQVARSQDNQWVLSNGFEATEMVINLDDASIQNEEAKKLTKYAVENNLNGRTATTNSQGKLAFSNIEKGIYLLVQNNRVTIGDCTYMSSPALFALPTRSVQEDVWDVVIAPKFENENLVKKDEATVGINTGDNMNLMGMLFLSLVSVGMFAFIRIIAKDEGRLLK